MPVDSDVVMPMAELVSVKLKEPPVPVGLTSELVFKENP